MTAPVHPHWDKSQPREPHKYLEWTNNPVFLDQMLTLGKSTKNLVTEHEALKYAQTPYADHRLAMVRKIAARVRDRLDTDRYFTATAVKKGDPRIRMLCLAIAEWSLIETARQHIPLSNGALQRQNWVWQQAFDLGSNRRDTWSLPRRVDPGRLTQNYIDTAEIEVDVYGVEESTHLAEIARGAFAENQRNLDNWEERLAEFAATPEQFWHGGHIFVATIGYQSTFDPHMVSNPKAPWQPDPGVKVIVARLTVETDMSKEGRARGKKWPAKISHVASNPHPRLKKGFAGRLLQQVLQQLDKENIPTVLTVSTRSKNAIELYRSLGYRECGGAGSDISRFKVANEGEKGVWHLRLERPVGGGLGDPVVTEDDLFDLHPPSVLKTLPPIEGEPLCDRTVESPPTRESQTWASRP